MRTTIIAAALFVLLSLPAGVARAQAGDSSAGIQIAEMKLGNNVQDREIVGEDSTFPKDSKVFLWMKVLGGASDSITVTWTTGSLSYTAKLFVGGSPWRTWAAKTVGVAGTWTVSVSDPAGSAIKETTFKVE